MSNLDGLIPSTAPNTPETEKALLESLRKFIVNNKDLRALERLIGRFNIFEVLQVQDREIRHSNMLAWLLDPAESHGLGDLFLRRWLIQVLHESGQSPTDAPDPIEIDAAQLKEVRVTREWLNLDVLIQLTTERGESWVVAVENKVWSEQHSDQLTRYRSRIESAFPRSRRILVLLSVRAEEPEDTSYVTATYEQVHAVLHGCVSEMHGRLGPEPSLVITHYLQLIQDHFMESSPVAQLARKIYESHRKALDLIFEHRPDTLEMITEALAELAKVDGAKWGLRYIGQRKGVIYLLPTSWDTPSNKRSDRDNAAWLEIFFYTPDRLMLKAVAGPTDKSWRQALFDLARVKKFSNTTRKKELPDQWYQFFATRTDEATVQDAEADNATDVAERMWKWCTEQFKQKEFLEMTSAVANILKEHPIPALSGV